MKSLIKLPGTFRPEKNLEEKTQNLIEESNIIETDSIVLEGDVEALLRDKSNYSSQEFDKIICSFLKREHYKEHPKSSKGLGFWTKENYSDSKTLDVFVNEHLPYQYNSNNMTHAFANVDKDKFDSFRKRQRNNHILFRSLCNKYTRNIACWTTAITSMAVGIYCGLKAVGGIFDDPGWLSYGVGACLGMFTVGVIGGQLCDLDLDTEIVWHHYQRKVKPLCNEITHYKRAIRKAFGVKEPEIEDEDAYYI